MAPARVWKRLDLWTKNAKAAARFYSRALGFKSEEIKIGDKTETLFSHDGELVAFLKEMPAGADYPGHWAPYFEVADLNALIAKLPAGALMGDIREDGECRYACIQDSTKAYWMVRQSTATSVPFSGKGYLWTELQTNDIPAAAAFYTSVLGWTSSNMGPDYVVLNQQPGNIGVAGIMPLTHGEQPHWTPYFRVDSATGARDKIKKNGGKILSEPKYVAGQGTWGHYLDPEGLFFATVEPDPLWTAGSSEESKKEQETATELQSEVKRRRLNTTVPSYEVTLPCGPEAAFKAVSTVDGFKGWWTTHVEAPRKGQFTFKFNLKEDGTYGASCTFQVQDSTDDLRLVMKCIDDQMNGDWKNTMLTFEVTGLADGRSRLWFKHRGMNNNLECFELINSTWGDIVLRCLPMYLETGTADPRFK